MTLTTEKPAVKERPILLSAPMVRATLAGHKTQTRRIIKWPPPSLADDDMTFPYYWGAMGTYSGVSEPRHYWTNRPPDVELDEDEHGPAEFDDETLFWPAGTDEDCSYTADVYGAGGLQSPYGSEKNCIKPAARLWVRETWRTAIGLDAFKPAVIAEQALDAGYRRPWCPVKYEADGKTDNGDVLRHLGGEWGKTRVAIHMPRWLSRITLEIVSVRIERLQDISEEDALAEGVASWLELSGSAFVSYRRAYAALWESIHGEGAWAENPWVWVLEFKRVAQPQEASHV